MKYLFVFVFLFFYILPFSARVKPDSVVVFNYFDEIKNDESLLNQFFMYMPKGGDLHNHLTGSIYAETYFDLAVKDRLWLDVDAGKLYPTQESALKSAVVNPIQLDSSMHNLSKIRGALLEKWSVRNYDVSEPLMKASNRFFNAFDLFLAPAFSHMVELLHELKYRAFCENIQYLEIMAMSPRIGMSEIDHIFGKGSYSRDNLILQKVALGDEAESNAALQSIFDKWEKNAFMEKMVKQYVCLMDSIDLNSSLEDCPDPPVCLYQSYAVRNADPLRVFAQLYLSFKACVDPSNTRFVGVNIISPENGVISMKYYQLHMRMFRFLRDKISSNVKLSIHAGELTVGLVKPEELGSHIREAVEIAGADRIGHGADIVFERESVSLIDEMRRQQIAVEINISSNEAVLGLKKNNHPFPIYYRAGVPLVISTDDAGVLRTNLAEQYTLLELRYKLSYYVIKKLVRSTIVYSFAPNGIKRKLLKRLDKDFTEFEAHWVQNIAIMKKWKS